MASLKLSDNSKVKFKSSHHNTFGLMYGLPKNGGTCPGATCGDGGCLDVRDGLKRQTCYMAKITAIYKGVGKVLDENTALLQGKTQAEMEGVLEDTVNQFVKKSPKDKLYFRLHYSGDFFSADYAKAWSAIIKKFPAVHFWAYTRSSKFVELLLGVPNLTLYLSSDPDNFKTMLSVYNKHKEANPNLGICFMGNEAPDPKLMRWVKCPEITGKVKNTPDAGACSKCRLCVDNYVSRVKNIQFPIH